MTNQMVDLIDANATHESLLPLLGNLFNLKLRSGDPTLWRRQIKNAIPCFKQKGTFNGLQKALGQAGIRLDKFTRLWQVISPHTHQELFDVESNTDIVFELSKLSILPVDTDNFELYYRGPDDDAWTTLTSDYVTLVNVDDVTVMTWVGDQLSVDPIILDAGDSIRVLYEVNEVLNPTEQTIEDYIRTLPLSDQRDERDQSYPLKNWNVRLIEEDDVLFDAIIPDRHPFTDPVIFGKIRTEFPYSENIYNMEEYNGSKRDSANPCHIDRQFVDECGKCQSSKFNIDIEIETLSDDRIVEATQIIREFKPFHAQLHSMNLVGNVNEFMPSPTETITALVYIAGQEMTVVDPPQTIFNRSMETNQQITRSALANVTTPVSGASGVISNDEIVIFAPTISLDQLGVEPDDSLTFLEILSPSANQGEYTISNTDKKFAVIASGSPTEPVDHSEFTFRLSNERIRKTTSTSITKDNYFTISDANLDFDEIGVKTQWDVDNDPNYTGAAWDVSIPAYGSTYPLIQLLPNGSLVIEDDGTLPSSSASSVTYTIRDDSATAVESSVIGSLTVKRRGLVDYSGGSVLVKGNSVLASDIDDIRSIMEIGNFVLYGSSQYKVSGFVVGETLKFYIDEWNGGDVSGITTIVYKRLTNNGRGFLHYRGLTLDTSPNNQETTLGILNGINAPVDPNLILEDDLFKENFLVYAGLSGSAATFKYYAIAEIDGTTITLAGPDGEFETTGTAVEYDILKYSKHSGTTIDPPYGMRYDPIVTIEERIYPPMPGHEFEFIDRRGNEVFEISVDNGMSMMSALSSLNAPDKNQIVDYITQKETITYSIEYSAEENDENN